MQFELFRAGLLERPRNLFEAMGVEERPNREQWLRGIFGREIVFVHRAERFHYVPDPDAQISSPIIVGRIGRQTAVPDHEPPEKGLAETKRDAWAAARVLLDPRHHADGQKIAVENASKVGHPLALMLSLARQINSSAARPYELEVSPILNADTFWAFVDRHRAEITSVAFEFVSPNMFGEKDDYDREMRELKEREKVRRAKLELENHDGLELDTPRVRRAVDYIAPGQGRIRAKTKKGANFQIRGQGQTCDNSRKRDQANVYRRPD